jgi:acyl carrier protein
MKKNDFLFELKDALMVEDVVFDDTTEIHLTSLSTLSVIAFFDENFDKQVKASELRNVHSVKDLIRLIGEENIE